jgi:hypothetical protein
MTIESMAAHRHSAEPASMSSRRLVSPARLASISAMACWVCFHQAPPGTTYLTVALSQLGAQLLLSTPWPLVHVTGGLIEPSTAPGSVPGAVSVAPAVALASVPARKYLSNRHFPHVLTSAGMS